MVAVQLEKIQGMKQAAPDLNLSVKKTPKHAREMHSSKKGRQRHRGMKSHIGVEAASGLARTVHGTAGHVADGTESKALVQAQETGVFADARCQRTDKRLGANCSVRRPVAMRPGKRKTLDKANNPIDALTDKVEHPFRVVKRQLGSVKVRLNAETPLMNRTTS
jgi:IS5 family transposase